MSEENKKLNNANTSDAVDIKTENKDMKQKRRYKNIFKIP